MTPATETHAETTVIRVRRITSCQKSTSMITGFLVS